MIQYRAICFPPPSPPSLPLRIKSEGSSLFPRPMTLRREKTLGYLDFLLFPFFLYNQKEVPFLANITPAKSPQS